MHVEVILMHVVGYLDVCVGCSVQWWVIMMYVVEAISSSNVFLLFSIENTTVLNTHHIYQDNPPHVS